MSWTMRCLTIASAAYLLSHRSYKNCFTGREAIQFMRQRGMNNLCWGLICRRVCARNFVGYARNNSTSICALLVVVCGLPRPGTYFYSTSPPHDSILIPY